jgi:hypothetical protein
MSFPPVTSLYPIENTEKRINNVPGILSPRGNAFVVNIFHTAHHFRGKRVSWTNKQINGRNNTIKICLPLH